MSSDDKPIGPTKERLRHAGEDVEEFITDTNRRSYRLNEVLDTLLRKRAITYDQKLAGDQIYSDWYDAGLSGSGAIDPSRDVVDGGQMQTHSDFVLAAMDRFNKAIARLSPIHLDAITMIVLLQVETLAQFGARVHLYKDKADASVAGASTVRDALSTLDYYYYGKRTTRMKATHVDGYRPTIPDES